jgi:hypothetical protein
LRITTTKEIDLGQLALPYVFHIRELSGTLHNSFDEIELKMVRYTNTSVLRRLDLDDIDSLKRVMDTLAVALEHGSTQFQHPKNIGKKLHALEGQWTEAIIKAINRNIDYPLLESAIVRFCGARMSSLAHIEMAVRELESLGDEDVLIIPESHIKEYTEASKQFEALPRSKHQRLLEEAHVRHFTLKLELGLIVYSSSEKKVPPRRDQLSVGTVRFKIQQKPLECVNPPSLYEDLS